MLARALLHQPVGGRQAEAADAADDEMHAFGVDVDATVRGAIATDVLAGDRRQHDDLADMAGTLHQAERADDLVGLESAIGQRREIAVLEQSADLA